MSPQPSSPPPLLTLRAAVVLALATLTAIAAAGLLTYLATHSAPTAVLGGGAAWATTVPLFDKLIS